MAMSKEEFQLMLDDVHEPIKFGGLTFNYGWALQKLDPVAFDVSYWNFVHSIEEEVTEE